MHEVNLHKIPAIARRIARDELANRVGILEAELAEAQSASVRLAEDLASVSQELENLRLAQAGRVAEQEKLNATLTGLTHENEALRSTMTERESAVRNCEEACAEAEARFASVSQELENLRLAQAGRVAEQEVETCRTLADRCVFVIGFARSNTTITLEMLNCAKNALILGEADFFLGHHGDRFSDWYNKQHCDFQNQVTKSSYAPDFLPYRPHSWWQWLNSAGQFYDCIGEKIALSHHHLSKAPPEVFRMFHEARFLTSRYVFMLRNPIDVLLSSAKLMSVVDDQGMAKLCAAWLDFMQLWADSIRVFPRTLTLIADRFGEATVSELEAFTDLDLGDARLLINPANRRRHKLTGKFPTLVRFRSELEELYADAIAAADENSVLWQAEQKRTLVANDTAGNAMGMIAMTSRPLGRVWLRIQALREVLTPMLKENV